MRLITKALVATTAFTVVSVTVHEASAIQCARYARIAGPIKIRGDAWTWWNKAIGKYARVKAPAEGAAIVFSKTRRNRFGHVAVISEVISPREIKVFHANWLNDGRVYKDQLVIDVSPDGDWSMVRVWHPGINRMGKHHFPIQGFIHPTKTPMADEYMTPREVMIARGISETAKDDKRRPIAPIVVVRVPARKPDVPAWTQAGPAVQVAVAGLPAVPLPRPDRGGLILAVAGGRHDAVPALESAEVERQVPTVAMPDTEAVEPAVIAAAPVGTANDPDAVAAAGLVAPNPVTADSDPAEAAPIEIIVAETMAADPAPIEIAALMTGTEPATVEPGALDIPAVDTTSRTARTILAAALLPPAPLPRPANALIATVDPAAGATPTTLVAALVSLPPRKPTPPTVAATVPAVQVATPPPAPLMIGGMIDEPSSAAPPRQTALSAAGSVDALARFGLTSGPVARFLPTRPGAASSTVAVTTLSPQPVMGTTREPVVIASGPTTISDTARARAAAERFGLTSGPVAKFLPQVAFMTDKP